MGRAPCVLPWIASMACAVAPTGQEAGDGAIRPVEPVVPGGAAAGRGACGRVANLSGDAGLWQLGRVRADGASIALVTGGPTGGVVPARLEPEGPIHLPPAFGPGTCQRLGIAAVAPVAVAACNHDPDGSNADGSQEVFLIDLAAGRASALTRRLDPWATIGGVAVSANGRRVVYTATGTLRRIDLNLGTDVALGALPSGAVTTRLPISDDGRVLLIAAPAGRQLWRYEVDKGLWIGLSAADGWGVTPDGDLDASGARVVYLSGADPLGRNPDGAAQVFLWDAALGALWQLTRYEAGPPRPASPRISADGRRVAFLSVAPIDGGAGVGWAYPQIVVIDLDASGTPSEPVYLPVPGIATEIALDRAGTTVDARVWRSGGHGAVRVALDGSAPPQELVVWAPGTEVVDLSRDGRIAAVRGTSGGPAWAAAVSLEDGSRVPLPWAGALDRGGGRVAALVSDGAGKRLLRVQDVGAPEDRIVPDAIALLGDPNVGPSGVALSGDGRLALFLSSVTGQRRLYAAALDGEMVVEVDEGVTQAPASVAVDERGERAVYWVAPQGTEPGQLRLWRTDGTRQILFETPDTQDARGPVAIAGDRVAFCVTWSYDASCRLAFLDLGPDGAPLGPPRSFLGVAVTGSLALDDRGTVATFVGDGPGIRGLLRIKLDTGELTRLAPPAMLRAIVRGDTCAWNAVDGGAIVASP